MCEQKTLALGAISMMRGVDHATLANPEHTSRGYMVRRVLLVAVVTCRTSLPSVRHMARAHVPGGGPVGAALDEPMSVAIDSEYLQMCVLCCVA